MKSIIPLTLTLAIALPASAAHAPKGLAEKLTAALPGLTVDALNQTEVKGIYELVSGKDVAYVSEDGRYMFQGILFDIENRKNLTEARLDGIRAKSLKSIKDEDTIVYAPKGAVKETITIFTDPSCPYCRKLHKEIHELNKAGIKVRYVMYPRDGIQSQAGKESLSILCSKNRLEELDKAMNGQSNTNTSCENSELEKSNLEKFIQLGDEMGLQGTPYIINSDGRAIPGYRPAKDLIQEIGRL